MQENELTENEINRLKDRLEKLKEEKMNLSQHNGKTKETMEKLAKNKIFLVSVAVIVIIIGVYLRATMLKFTGFFEPDAFYYYSILTQAAKSFIIPHYSIYSGFPTPNPTAESKGIYYVTLVPYFFLRYFGVSVYTVQRNIPMLFGIFDMIGAFFLVKYLAKSNVLGLLALTMVAFSSGDAARTSALVYRGDGFITIFLIVALILILKGLDLESKRKYVFMTLGAVILGIGTGVWTGSPFTIAVYMLAIIFFIIYGFIKGKGELLKNAIFLSSLLLLIYGIEKLFEYTDIIPYTILLSGINFFVFFIPILAGSVLGYLILENKVSFFSRINRDAATRVKFLISLMFIIIIILVVVLGNYLNLLFTGGGGIVASNAIGITTEELQPPSFPFLWISFSMQLFLAPIGILAFILISKKREFSDVSVNNNYGFLGILAYLVITSWLQAGAVRYNSIVAVPIAIFAAYAIYSIGKIFFKGNIKIKNFDMLYVYIAVALIMILIIAYTAYAQSNTDYQADGINPAFLNATLWLKNNTPANSTVLTMWPDGSVVEGFGNRRSYTDSVGGEINSRITPFAQFLFNDSVDTNYLYKIRPDYLLVRNYWFDEISGIAIEGLVTNISAYGIDPLSLGNTSYNSTNRESVFQFKGSPFSAALIVKTNVNGSREVAAYESYNGASPLPLDSVLFYDSNNGVYSFTNTTGNVKLTLFISYSQVNNQSLNINSVDLLGPKLPESNFFKLTTLCNNIECEYNNKNVTLSLVYANSDTKIFKVNYNAT